MDAAGVHSPKMQRAGGAWHPRLAIRTLYLSTLCFTVLFSDIRNFTRMSEGMTPADTFSFVNQYLGAMEPAISGHSGVIDKFVGDAVMALFPRRADDAVQGALDMIRRLETWNAKRGDRNKPPVKIGIGLHTGSLMLGTVGARDRMDTTVISDAVNLASRVENLTKTYRVPLIITEATLLALHDPAGVSVRRIDRVLVQGKSQPVVLYEVLDAHDLPARQAKQRALADFEKGELLYEARDFSAPSAIWSEPWLATHQTQLSRFCLNAHAVSLGRQKHDLFAVKFFASAGNSALGRSNQWTATCTGTTSNVFGRGSWIRTNDLQYPKLPRYQAALYPDHLGNDVVTRLKARQQGGFRLSQLAVEQRMRDTIAGCDTVLFGGSGDNLEYTLSAPGRRRK